MASALLLEIAPWLAGWSSPVAPSHGSGEASHREVAPLRRVDLGEATVEVQPSGDAELAQERQVVARYQQCPSVGVQGTDEFAHGGDVGCHEQKAENI